MYNNCHKILKMIPISSPTLSLPSHNRILNLLNFFGTIWHSHTLYLHVLALNFHLRIIMTEKIELESKMLKLIKCCLICSFSNTRLNDTLISR